MDIFLPNDTWTNQGTAPYNQPIDLTKLPDYSLINNNPNFEIRDVAVFSPIAFSDSSGSHAANTAYMQAQSHDANNAPVNSITGSTYKASSTWRMDMVTLTGTYHAPVFNPVSLSWNAGSGTWDSNASNQPWLNGATASPFHQSGGLGDNVTFNNPASGSVITIQSGGVTPNSTNISTNGTLTFTGGGIGGTGGLTKTGSGTLILDNSNSFTGSSSNGSSITGGTLRRTTLRPWDRSGQPDERQLERHDEQSGIRRHGDAQWRYFLQHVEQLESLRWHRWSWNAFEIRFRNSRDWWYRHQHRHDSRYARYGAVGQHERARRQSRDQYGCSGRDVQQLKPGAQWHGQRLLRSGSQLTHNITLSNANVSRNDLTPGQLGSSTSNGDSNITAYDSTGNYSGGLMTINGNTSFTNNELRTAANGDSGGVGSAGHSNQLAVNMPIVVTSGSTLTANAINGALSVTTDPNTGITGPTGTLSNTAVAFHGTSVLNNPNQSITLDSGAALALVGAGEKAHWLGQHGAACGRFGNHRCGIDVQG